MSTPTPPPPDDEGDATNPAATPTETATPEETATPNPEAVNVRGHVYLLGSAPDGADATAAPNVQVMLTDGAGATQQTTTGPDGTYGFLQMPAGDYDVSIDVPDGYAPAPVPARLTGGAGAGATSTPTATREIARGSALPSPERAATARPTATETATPTLIPPTQTPGPKTHTLHLQTGESISVDFALRSLAGPSTTPTPTGPRDTPTPAPATPSGTQVAVDASALLNDLASADATNQAVEQLRADQANADSAAAELPIQFAEGRDLLAQLERRTLPDGSLWLGVPFRTQMDGGEYQAVNCGPASLVMVLAGFGLDVGPSQVRDYLNALTADYSHDAGTSLDTISTIARQAGLATADLYGPSGNYLVWTPDAIRWHIQQGQPVITLVKYKDLPGHTSSLADTDHYIVITGLAPGGFIYNDGAFSSTLGYGLEISDDDLERAWDVSSIPHYGVAFALPNGTGALTFPGLPATPTPTAASLPTATPEPLSTATSVPNILASDVSGGEPDAVDAPSGSTLSVDLGPSDDRKVVAPVTGSGALVLDATTETTYYAPGDGPGRIASEALLLLGGLWLLLLTWSASGWALRVLGRRGKDVKSAALALATLLPGIGP